MSEDVLAGSNGRHICGKRYRHKLILSVNKDIARLIVQAKHVFRYRHELTFTRKHAWNEESMELALQAFGTQDIDRHEASRNYGVPTKGDTYAKICRQHYLQLLLVKFRK